ncbi:MAG: RHS repeat-associated core domain-containing protein, partial [Monoglobaceae bacterium]
RVYYRYDEKNSPIGFDLTKDGTTSTYTYEKNVQGDIVGIISDSTRRRVVTYVYDAWGNLTDMYGTAADTVGKYNSLRYRGYYYDSETGYYYLQSRYYDPGYKRFINADEPMLISYLTKASVLGGNLFAYCENNAINYIDTDGYISVSITIYRIIGGIAGAFGGYYIGNAVANALGLTGFLKSILVGAISALGAVAGFLLPTMSLKYLALRAALWAAGSAFLTVAKYPVARMLYSHGIWGGGKSLSSSDNNKLSKALTNVANNVKEIKDFLRNEADNLLNSKKLKKDSYTKINNLVFKSSSNKYANDLYYAIHGTTYTAIKGEKKKGKYYLTVLIKDVYDFFPWQAISGFGSVVNDLGCLMQSTAIILTYNISVTFSCTV